jgi:2-polyprenyl-6-methoxyphenol hydroxylase-like FAD-dependent oxidoreductase
VVPVPETGFVMELDGDVIIAGAGPNGLMLAAELALGGVRPLVLERLTGPSDEQRANGMVGQIVRMMDRRGLYQRLTGTTAAPRPVPAFMFAAFPLELAQLPDNPVYTMLVPQRRIEQILAERAAELRVEIRRGHALAGLAQQDDRVTVEVEGPDGGYRVEAPFLVGADGGRSRTRKLVGIDFPGITRDHTVSRTAHVSVPPRFVDRRGGGLQIPGYGVIPPFMHHRTERGVVAWAPMPDRPAMLTVSERGSVDESVPFTLAELAGAFRRVVGADLPIGAPAGAGPHLLRRLTGGNTRVAERYREGGVFLVGDAAHVHSAIGGPGLNLGLQDAINLGWKLIGVLRGWAPAGLLDTYESERRPVAQRVTMHTEAQGVLVGPGPEVTALRTLFGEFLQDQANVQRIADLISGADIRYPHMERWAPEISGPVRLAELTRAGRPLLLDPDGSWSSVAGPWRDRVDVVTGRGEQAMLLRPDCYVAWRPDSRWTLPEALRRWFGEPLI